MSSSVVSISEAREGDDAAIWRILEPIIREGSTYTLPVDMSQTDALKYWRAASHEVFVAESDLEIVGTYFMRPNQAGGGAHVANCGYMTAPWAAGRGIARLLSYQVCDELASGMIVRLLPKFEPPPVPVHLVVTTARHMPAHARAFLDHAGRLLKALSAIQH